MTNSFSSHNNIPTVKSSVTSKLGDNIKRLFLTGADNIDGTGNNLNNVILGNSGRNTLRGEGGVDIMNGGKGRDTIFGGEGDDRLNGGKGADYLVGGNGNDIYKVDNVHDTVSEVDSNGRDTVRSFVTYTLGDSLENLFLIGTDNIEGTGNSLNNVIVGNSGINTLRGEAGNDIFNGAEGEDTIFGGEGNDTLNGGEGADHLVGGNGNDIYKVDNVHDTVCEVDSEGIDTVRSFVSYTLGDNVENLFLIETDHTDNIDGTGNCLNNVILGNSGINILRGEAGDDIIDGGDGDDTLIGGVGHDRLTGGCGVNTFRFYDSGEGVDIISDFKAGTDKIQISACGFDSALSLGHLDTTAFIAGAGITTACDSAHRFIYNTSNGALFFDADGSGSHSNSIQIAVLSGTPALSNTDIFVI